MLGETHTPKEFNKLIIAGIKTNSGNVYDLLFDEKGELIKPGEQAEAVNYLADFFNKTLQPAYFSNFMLSILFLCASAVSTIKVMSIKQVKFFIVFYDLCPEGN